MKIRKEIQNLRREGAIVLSFRRCRPSVGLVKSNVRPGSFEELVRVIPRDVEFLPLYHHVEKGSEDEFKGAIDTYWKAAALLVQQ